VLVNIELLPLSVYTSTSTALSEKVAVRSNGSSAMPAQGVRSGSTCPQTALQYDPWLDNSRTTDNWHLSLRERRLCGYGTNTAVSSFI
jgi:hypothetical protein